MTRFIVATAAMSLCGVSFAEQWQIDRAHSAAQFAVRHLMVSTVRGHFGKLTGTVNYDPKNPTAASLQAEVEVASIDTREPKRDADLKGPNFFDAEKFPTMTFKSTKVESAGAGRLKMTGDLTLRGVTKQVVFDVEGPTAPIKDKMGERMGASATAKISRKEFGMEGGRATVGDEVTIIIDVELIRPVQPRS
jgi:polyisoprenoid-binding protein YceI